MSIVESDGPPSWSLDVSETGESTKCPWVGVMGLKAWGEGAEKIGRLQQLHSVSCSRRQRQHLIGVRDNRVHQSIAERWQLKWKWHSSLRDSGQNSIDFRRECFDYDCLCLLLVLEDWWRKQKEAISRLQKDFPTCGSSSTPICIFKRSARRISLTPALSGRNILFLSALSELTPHHKHTHLVHHRNLRPLLTFLESEKSSFVPHSFDSTF